MTDLDKLAQRYHDSLPGLARATLIDFGIADEVIDDALLGWDGDAITVPVCSHSSRVVFFERWDPARIGEPLDNPGYVELYGRDALPTEIDHLVLAEGIHEALTFRSRGLPVLAATGSGRFFKTREWTAVFQDAEEVLLAFKSSERVERARHLNSRREVVERARKALPQASEVLWPNDYPRDAGALRFFVEENHSAEDFLALPRR